MRNFVRGDFDMMGNIVDHLQKNVSTAAVESVLNKATGLDIDINKLTIDDVSKSTLSAIKKQLEEKAKKTILEQLIDVKYIAPGLQIASAVSFVLKAQKTLTKIIDTIFMIYNKKVSDFVFQFILGSFGQYKDEQYSFELMARNLLGFTLPGNPETIPGYNAQLEKLKARNHVDYEFLPITFLQFYPYYTGFKSRSNVMDEIFPEFRNLDRVTQNPGSRWRACLETGAFLRDVVPYISIYLTSANGEDADKSESELSSEFKAAISKVSAIPDEILKVSITEVVMPNKPSDQSLGFSTKWYDIALDGVPEEFVSMVNEAIKTKSNTQYYHRTNSGIIKGSNQYSFPNPLGTILVSYSEVSPENLKIKRESLAYKELLKFAVDYNANQKDVMVYQASILNNLSDADKETFSQVIKDNPYPFKGISIPFYFNRINKIFTRKVAERKKQTVAKATKQTSVGVAVAAMIALGYFAVSD